MFSLVFPCFALFLLITRRKQAFFHFFFEFLKLWKRCGQWGGMISPSAVYLFIESKRLKDQVQAGFMKHDVEAIKERPDLHLKRKDIIWELLVADRNI